MLPRPCHFAQVVRFNNIGIDQRESAHAQASQSLGYQRAGPAQPD